MKSECMKFQADIADYVLGRYEYIKDYEALFKHLEECADCRNQLFGMKGVVYEFQKAAVPPEEVARRMQAIKDIFKKTPPQPTGPVANLRATLKQGIALYKEQKYSEARRIFSGMAQVLSMRSRSEVPIISGNQKLPDAERAEPQRSPDDFGDVLADAYYHLGLVDQQLNNPIEAINNFSRSIEQEPYDADAYYQRAAVYNLLNQIPSALQDYTSAVRNNPDYTEAYINRGLLYVAMNRYSDTIADCNKAIEVSPGSIPAYAIRALAYEMMGKYLEAIADCTQAIGMIGKPKWLIYGAYTIRGRSYGILGEFDKAMKDFNQVIELDPEDPHAYFYRGVLYARDGKLKEAIADFRHSLKLKPGDANAIDSLAKAEKELLMMQATAKIERSVMKAIASAFGETSPAGGKATVEKQQKNEISELRKEIESLKDTMKLVLEIAKQKPEYHYHIQQTQPQWSPDYFGTPEITSGIFSRKPYMPVVMPVVEKHEINGKQ